MFKERLSSQPRSEQATQPAELEHSEGTDWSELSFSLMGLVDFGRDRLRRVVSNVQGNYAIESAHKNWDNVNYCRHLSQDAARPYTVEKLIQVFPANFRAFTDEYCLGSLVKEYPLSVAPSGTTGFDDSYQETLTAHAQRFQEEKIVKLHRHQQRGAIEIFNSQRLDTWLSQACFDEEIPIGTKLVWCSPPGFKVEGYHGVSGKNHSFIWVYQKELGADGTPKMTMTQFRCWPNLSQMESIQKALRAKSVQTPLLENSPLPAQKLTRRNRVIQQFIELPPEVSFEEIEDEIYQTEDSWQVNRSDMPQLFTEQVTGFNAYRDSILEQFLVPLYQEILLREPRLKESYNSPFWNSEEYRQLVQKLDVVFAIAWQNLLKYVESIDGKPHVGRPAVPPAEVDQLREIYALKLKANDGNATQDDRVRFNDIAPQLLSAGSRALSIGQCGIGTLIPVQLIKGFEGVAGLSGVTSLSGLSRFDIMKLSAAEQLAFRTDVLGQYKPMTLISRFGNHRKFWVKAEYLQEYLEHSYQGPNGEFYGPCDVPLVDGMDEFVLSDSKYQELLGATQRPNLQGLAQLEREESQLLATASTEADRDIIKNNFRHRRKKLKERISVTELVNNDLFRPTFTRV